MFVLSDFTMFFHNVFSLVILDTVTELQREIGRLQEICQVQKIVVLTYSALVPPGSTSFVDQLLVVSKRMPFMLTFRHSF